MTSTRPSFAVLISVYAKDNPDLFRKALQSIFDNTLRPKQILLVVDGPVPESLDDVIREYQPYNSLKVIRIPKNQGLAHALNVGLSHVQAEWISRADADDINHPERFMRTYDFVASNPGIDIVSSNILEVDVNGQPVAERRLPESDSAIKQFAKSRNPFNHMATSYRKAFVERCGGYPDVHLKEDYALWCLMFQQGAKAHNLQTILVRATAGRDMYKRRGGWRYAQAEYRMQIILVKSGLKNPINAILDGLVRACVYLLPEAARGYIYEKFLRHEISESHL